ncbi:MAG: PQQ-binding-like beta-propeller repeat protein [Planctomycetia bacterium]|nr:PQQ-binding-like beta-propeller repeat protein [Planctomycetia bacterium]
MTADISLYALRAAVLLVAGLGMASYVTYLSPRPVEYATAQRDHSENRMVKKVTTQIGESFTRFSTVSETPETFGDVSWPCFRGVRRDNLAEAEAGLETNWGAEGPKVLWRKPLGEGYSGAIIVGGRVYVLDYLEEESSDSLRCFHLVTGEEIWRRSYRNPIRRNHGKSRTVPAFADGVVVTLGPSAHVMAVDAVSGDLLWTCDLVEKYGCEVPQWYAGQCPLIDEGRVILAIGGKEVLMAALDLKTGETVWEVPNTSGFQMSHASILPTVLAERKQYVCPAIGGISACDVDGKLLWQCTQWKPAVWAPTPVPIGGDRLFLTAGYGAGGAILSVTSQNGRMEAKIDQEWKPTQGPASEQQTPLVIGETLFAIQPKDAGRRRGELTASPLDRIPEITASSGREARFGLGPYLYVDGAFWIVDDDGVLSVFRFENQQFVELARHKILPGVDSWGPIAFAGGRMILRDSTSMVCLDLRRE